MTAGVVIGPDGLDELVKNLWAGGFTAVGPVLDNGAIVFREIHDARALPAGWRDVQEPGSYRVVPSGDDAVFGWAAAAQSLKPQVFPPNITVWRAKPPRYQVDEGSSDAPAVAVVGARPCDVAALEVLDRVLDGPVADPVYRHRRHRLFIVAVECYRPADTCFCVAMGTGPGISEGFDIALTELTRSEEDGDARTTDVGTGGPTAGPALRYLARAGSQAGRQFLAGVPSRPAGDQDHADRAQRLARAASRMGRSVDTRGLAELLARNLGNPRWDEVAGRCLVCGNCTAVCPTCFCTNFADTTDLEGTVERRRTWASCADLAYSYVHGGPVRSSIKSRYRQWATHKFSWWWEQFGTSGCVGCGRCITWCPARIDITEELAAIRAQDGATSSERS